MASLSPSFPEADGKEDVATTAAASPPLMHLGASQGRRRSPWEGLAPWAVHSVTEHAEELPASPFIPP